MKETKEILRTLNEDYKEQQAKLSRILSTLNDDDLTGRQRELVYQQSNAINLYCHILKERIDDLKAERPAEPSKDKVFRWKHDDGENIIKRILAALDSEKNCERANNKHYTTTASWIMSL